MAVTQRTLGANEQNESLWRATYAHTSEELAAREPNQRTASYANVSDTERIVSSVGGGALAVYGLTRGDWLGVGLTALGAYLLERGVSGYCYGYEAAGISTAPKQNVVSVKAKQGVKVERAMTINAPAADLYNFWRNFENLPKFMNHLEAVTVIDQSKSHWKAKAPLGATVEWDAEIISEIPNNLIAWRSLENADVSNAGSVRFEPATGGRGTVVKVSINYEPPAGKIGAAVAWLTGEEPSAQVLDDLRRFKQLMEAREIPTIEGQPAGRTSSQTIIEKIVGE